MTWRAIAFLFIAGALAIAAHLGWQIVMRW